MNTVFIIVLSLTLILPIIYFILYRHKKIITFLNNNLQQKTNEYDNLQRDNFLLKEKYNLLSSQYEDKILFADKILTRYTDLEKLENEIIVLKKSANNYHQNYEELQTEYDKKYIELNDNYLSKKKIYDTLCDRIEKIEYENELNNVESIISKYNYPNLLDYEKEISKVRERQRQYLKQKLDDYLKETPAKVTINLSTKEGKKLIKDINKIFYKSFNTECDYLISKLKYNNHIDIYKKFLELSLKYSFGSLGAFFSNVDYDYYLMKQQEMDVYYAYKHKLFTMSEERKKIREKLREEEIVRQEIERVLIESEEKEKIFNEELERAKKELEYNTGEELLRLNEKIKILEQKLKDTNEMKERAISRAQLTKSGHVYIISNIGSFGNDVYKIGMTRRLEPLDRIRELSDASVPFPFDVHAMIYSENAPELENKLQNAFKRKRINFVNIRKEFFNVSLDEIEKEVVNNFKEVEFIKIAEARQFRETKAMQTISADNKINEVQIFPDKLIDDED